MLDNQKHAFLIGWNLDNFNCCIVNVIALPAESYDDLNKALERVLATHPLGLRGSKNEARPVILGEWCPDSVGERTVPEVRHQERGIWITLTAVLANPNSHDGAPVAAMPRPELASLYSCGCRYNISCYLFRYDATAPERHYYLTINLPKGFGFFSLGDLVVLGDLMEQPHNMEPTDLECVVEQINSSSYLKHQLNSVLREYYGLQLETGPAAPEYKWSRLILSFSWIFIRVSCMWYYFSCRSCELITNSSDNAKTFLKSLTWLTHDIGTVDWSKDSDKGYHIFVSINHLRKKFLAVQSSFHVYMLVTRNHTLTPVERQSHWIFLWSYIMRTICDVLVGCIVGAFLIRYNREIMSTMFSFGPWLQNELLIKGIQWFDSTPGGLKLNPTLTCHIGGALTTIINYFGEIVLSFSNMYKHVLFVIADVGVFGVTMQLAVLVDVLRVATVHLNFIQFVFSLLHKLQVSVLTSMWLLFTGRKKNVLRKRIDTGEYSQSQVVLGTTFFSISFFLFPTFCIYYAAFTAAQLFIVVICSTLIFFVGFLQAFPICHLVLHYWYPESLVTGIKISFDEAKCDTIISLNSATSGQVSLVSTRRRVSNGSASASIGLLTSVASLNRPARQFDFNCSLVPAPVGVKGILKKREGTALIDNIKNKSVANEIQSGGLGFNTINSSVSFDASDTLLAVRPFGANARDDAVNDNGVSVRCRQENTLFDSSIRTRASADEFDNSSIIDESTSDNVTANSIDSSRDLGEVEKKASFSIASNPSDDGNLAEGETYRPLDEYSFFSLQPEDRDTDVASDDGKRYSSQQEYKTQHLKDTAHRQLPVSALHVPHILGALKADDALSSPRSPISLKGKHKMSPAAGKTGSASKSVHLNILPQKTGMSTIMANFVYLWNNKANRDFAILFVKELMYGIIVGSISLNMRTLSVVENFCRHQLNRRNFYTTGDSKRGEHSNPHVNENIAIDGDIVSSFRGDTLIDYFGENVMKSSISFTSPAHAVRANADSDMLSPGEPSDSDIIFSDGKVGNALSYSQDGEGNSSPACNEDARLVRARTPFRHNITQNLPLSSPNEAIGGEDSESLDPYSTHRGERVPLQAGATEGGRKNSPLAAARKTAWAVSPARVSNFWEELYTDSALEITHTDVVSNTFRIPDLFLSLFWMQSAEFLFLAVGVLLLWADVLFLCFPELMPIWYLNLFFKDFV